MNKQQKDVIRYKLDEEKKVLEALEKQYQRALNDIDRRIRILESDELTQSRIYRIEYQKALRKQVEAVLEKLHADQYSTIQQFLSDAYTTGYIGNAYDLHSQGVPLILPIDPKAAVKAVMTDSQISEGLYTALGVDTKKLKKTISSEITRGLSAGMSHNDIARNIARMAKAPLARAKTIVRTESHRIAQAAIYDNQKAAVAKGANVVKQWMSTLDGDTRKSHRKLDGQIREIDEPFEMDGKKAMYPGKFGDPAEDCNCRCEVLQRARLALNEDELKTLEERAEFFGLDKTADFEDFRKKYMKAMANAEKPLENDGKSGIISIEASALPDRFKKYVPKKERRIEIIKDGIDLPRPIFDGGLLGRLAKGIQPLEGYYDVVLHGTEYGFEYFGEPVDVETLCAIIAQRKDYKKGTKIRLIACNSGTATDGVARYISNKLHITVLAPDKKAVVERLRTGETIVYSGSDVGIHDGEFIPFEPEEGVEKT